MKKVQPHNKKNAGFVALFAVLVSSILLAMALSIVEISYKEQLLSVNAKVSQYSFMAADTGMEVALLNDVTNNIFSVTDPNPPFPDITYSNVNYPALTGPTVPTYKIPVIAIVNGQNIEGCAVLSVNRFFDSEDVDTDPDATRIESRGYNVNCDNIVFNQTGLGDVSFLNGSGARAVERFLIATYSNTSPDSTTTSTGSASGTTGTGTGSGT